jgi:hypothetical protein
MRFLLYISLVFSTVLYAQDKDLPKSSTKSSGALLQSGRVSSGNNLLGVPNRPQVKNLFAKPKKGINFKPKEKFMDPSDLFTKKLNAKPEDETKMSEKFAKDMYLGDFVTTSDKIVFLCRDHMMFDGDRVQVRLNGQIIIQNLLLENPYKEITIPLAKGFNKIEFVALNQGESGPNTAELKAIDNGTVITRNVWNLLTGVKATTVVVRN